MTEEKKKEFITGRSSRGFDELLRPFSDMFDIDRFAFKGFKIDLQNFMTQPDYFGENLSTFIVHQSLHFGKKENMTPTGELDGERSLYSVGAIVDSKNGNIVARTSTNGISQAIISYDYHITMIDFQGQYAGQGRSGFHLSGGLKPAPSAYIGMTFMFPFVSACFTNSTQYMSGRERRRLDLGVETKYHLMEQAAQKKVALAFTTDRYNTTVGTDLLFGGKKNTYDFFTISKLQEDPGFTLGTSISVAHDDNGVETTSKVAYAFTGLNNSVKAVASSKGTLTAVLNEGLTESMNVSFSASFDVAKNEYDFGLGATMVQ